MTLDKFTIKAQEAVQQAVNTAQLNGQQVIEPVHILKGIMEKAKDVTTFIFQKLGVNAQQVEMLTDQEIKHLPRVQGGQPYLSNESNNVLVRAQELSQKWGDEFVACEPVLQALLTVNSTASRIMKDRPTTTTSRWRSMPKTSSTLPVRVNSTPSSDVTTKSVGCSRFSRAVQRTTPF